MIGEGGLNTVGGPAAGGRPTDVPCVAGKVMPTLDEGPPLVPCVVGIVVSLPSGAAKVNLLKSLRGHPKTEVVRNPVLNWHVSNPL